MPTPLMTGRSTLAFLVVVALVVALLLQVRRPVHATQAGSHPAAVAEAGEGIPASIRHEHAEIQAELERATKAPGRVGASARALRAVLQPHFEREEQVALPPLGLLEPLSRGENPEDMHAILPLTDSLRAELPQMLAEHVQIRSAVERLGKDARAVGNARVERLAGQLAHHARSEEEILYPSAVLVGEVVRSRLQAGSTSFRSPR